MSKQSNEQGAARVGGSGASEEKEVTARSYDQAAVQERMTKLRDKQKAQKEKERVKENEINQIVVKDDDVAALVAATTWTAPVATRRLRERQGDFAAVLKDILNGKYLAPVKA
jgi:flagellar biosynthesis GTPase FlhF